MFDIAYVIEASIVVAERIKEFYWQKLLASDLSKPMACFAEARSIQDMNSVIRYYSIMYGTHGV